MAPLAYCLHQKGIEVSGSDVAENDEIARLRTLGIAVTIGHDAAVAHGADAVVVTDAINLEESPEVRWAREQGVPLFRRSQLLGHLLRDRKTLAVTGTHGKTTTTGMVGAALQAAGLSPWVLVGAYVPEWGSSLLEGEGEYAVVEACEAYDALRDLDPSWVVLTNFEADHLDFHGTAEALEASILRFVARIPEGGGLVYDAEDAGASRLAEKARDEFGVRIFGYSAEEATPLELALPGEHNQRNALGALTLARCFEVKDLDAVRTALRDFRGAERRLQVIREGDVTVVDDYAHHPREIRASIEALRTRFPGRRLVVVYQPHLYSRTAAFLVEFAEALSLADAVVLTDIYPAREKPMPGVSSARLAERIQSEVDYVPSRHLLPRFVAERVRPGDVVVGMGAGNISEFVPGFLAELDRPNRKHVAVLFGGDSAEREVSLHSGRAIHAALQRQGWTADLVDVTEILLSGGALDFLVGADRPDVCFLALHGTHAEDGAVQGLLELLHLPYTGSGIQSSALAMDKAMAKEVLAGHGVPVPQGIHVRSADDPRLDDLPWERMIVKPNAQGSTVGLSFVESRASLREAIERALHYDQSVLVEEWIVGRELSVPVLVDQVLPVVEIVPKSGRYDFEMKYTPGATEEICPAPLDPDVAEVCQRYALAAHRALRCHGATRTDMILRADGTPAVLEVNTLPGMTQTSLLPRSAEAAGISFDELCVRILEDALHRSTSKA